MKVKKKDIQVAAYSARLVGLLMEGQQGGLAAWDECEN